MSFAAWCVMWTAISFVVCVVCIGLFGGTHDTAFTRLLGFLERRRDRQLTHLLEMERLKLRMLEAPNERGS